MKKSNIVLITLEILLIIVVVCSSIFGNTLKSIDAIVQKELGENELPSLNYLLKYQMPEGYEEAMNLYGEVALATPDGNSNFSIDILENEKMTSQQFFETQETIFEQSANYTVVSENTSDEKDRKITKKIYDVSNDFTQFFALVGTIEIKNHPDQFIGVVGTATSQDTEETLDFLLSTTNYTKQKADEEKLFSSDLEDVTIISPPNWKRLERAVPYSFYKQDENNITYLIASTSNRKEEDPQESYEYAKTSLSSDPSATIIEDSTVQTVDNKTITTSIIEYSDSYATTIITLIEFKDSDTFTIVRTDVVSEDGIDYIKSDVDYIINSINLK